MFAVIADMKVPIGWGSAFVVHGTHFMKKKSFLRAKMIVEDADPAQGKTRLY